MRINTKQGFVKIIVTVVVALIILGYYNIDVKKVIDNPIVKKNLLYGYDLALTGIHYVKDRFK